MAGVYGSDWVSWFDFAIGLSANLGWPIAAVLVALVAKSALPDAFRRLHKLGPSGLELYPHPEDQTKGKEQNKPTLNSTDLEPLVDPAAAEIETALHADLQKITESQREAVLTRALTNSIMATSFATVYAHIFGSQISFLELLNSRSVNRDEADAFLGEHQKQDELLRSWSLDNYLQFLFYWKLIEATGSEYRITLTGRSFLQFLVQKGLSKDRLH